MKTKVTSSPTGTASPEAGEPRIRLTGLVKKFRRESGEEVNATDHISLDVYPGEFVVLLGPSGCGKTTLLRLIAGLETPDAGRIVMDGNVVYDSASRVDVAPERRPAGMVFQSYALWPHMTAFDNVAYPLKSRRVNSSTVRERVEAVLEMVGVGKLAKQFPAQMSGGQQQRVAVARALVAGDNTILFDEPLSNIDAKVREDLRMEILTMQRELGFTALYVTHDQEEALTLASRVVLLNEGRIAQLGPPKELYERPAALYAAGFIGTINTLRGVVGTPTKAHSCVDTAIGKLKVLEPIANAVGDAVIAVSRPERWKLSANRCESDNVFSGIVDTVIYLGSHQEYIVRVGDQSIRVRGDWSEELEVGREVWLALGAPDIRVFGSE